MAFENLMLFLGIAAFLIIIGIILLLVFNRLTAQDRIQKIKAYKAAPKKTADAPVLIHGPAGLSGVITPTGGDPVAFHATFIMSRGCTLIRDVNHRKPLPENTSFKVFTMSGDFPVTEAGVSYRVGLVSTVQRMSAGAEFFTKNVKQNAVLDGLPESVFDDMVSFEAAIQALAPVFSITETGRSVTSSIDSRVSRFIHGRDVPPAITDMLKGKIIRPQPGEEITVMEFFIPLKKSVWVFGEFSGGDTVRYGEDGTGLSVSYADPETAGI
jgi:hypothetical protein